MTARGIRAGTGAAVLLSLVSCGPVPVAKAERDCAERFRPTPFVSGEAQAGVTTSGIAQKIELEVRPGVEFGDPSAAYNACVQRRSGEFPTRPLQRVGVS